MMIDDRDDALQDMLLRKAFRRLIPRRVHYVLTAEGFGAAVRAGVGWEMYPAQLAAPALADGSFVRISDVHLDVPLYWQCWKLDSPTVQALTDAVGAAAASLRRRRKEPDLSIWWMSEAYRQDDWSAVVAKWTKTRPEGND